MHFSRAWLPPPEGTARNSSTVWRNPQNLEGHCLDVQLPPFITKTERSCFPSEGAKKEKKKKKLSGKTWHIPEQPNLELISRERLHGPGDCTSSCQLGMFSVANGLVGHSKNPSSAEEKLIFSRGSQSFLKGPRRAPGSEFFKAQMYHKHT